MVPLLFLLCILYGGSKSCTSHIMDFSEMKKKDSFLQGGGGWGGVGEWVKGETSQCGLIKGRCCTFQIVYLFYFDFTTLETSC